MGVKGDIPPANNMKFIIDKSISTDEDTFAECLRESDSYTKGSKGRQDYIDNSMERLYRFFKNMVLSGIKFQGPTLDVASGWGILYPCFRKYFRDMLPYFIAELNCCEIEYDGERIPNVKFECDKEELPIEDSKFGVIVFCDILEHLIVDPVWTILELNRVLKRGHHLIINTPNAAASIKILDICAGRNPMTENHIKPSSIYQRHNREYTPDEIQKLMDAVVSEIVFSQQMTI
jgi:SAM-dependent methyltransferase